MTEEQFKWWNKGFWMGTIIQIGIGIISIIYIIYKIRYGK